MLIHPSQPGRPLNTWRTHGTQQELTPQTFERADSVTVSLQNPKAEDALLAAGMALAKNKPLTLQAPDRSHLPWFLQEADLSYPGTVTVVENAPQKEIDRTPVKDELRQPQEHDTFIGCLMSGLSKEQYAEGRSHLLAIHTTLKDKLASPNNFCEGINVGSSDSFGTPKESLVTDLEAIKGSDNCVFYQYDDSSPPSGMWVELGAALAWGKPCTLFAPNLEGVPEAIKNGMAGLKVVKYGDHRNFQKILREQPQRLTAG
ncbi:MAG: hypothetical protein KC800_28115 [Candidatus Eremiobacteraeota bacterium]|nr:hypothetical protein [Candidatus Eremiobacteraeota bacterium]